MKTAQRGSAAPEIHHLWAVDHVFVALAFDPGADIGGVDEATSGWSSRRLNGFLLQAGV